MNSPSKEAKEAADAAWKELSGKSIFGAYAMGYDAGSAKLREERTYPSGGTTAMNEAKTAAEWTITPVSGKEGWNWEGLAYISDGKREYGSFNKEQAIAICKAHNAATAKLRDELKEVNDKFQRCQSSLLDLAEASAKHSIKLRDENERLLLVSQTVDAELHKENERLRKALKKIAQGGNRPVDELRSEAGIALSSREGGAQTTNKER